MPEYTFKYNQNPGDLYMPFYCYFLERWHDPDLPEYDLYTDELIYRDASGNELKRKDSSEMPSSYDMHYKQHESEVAINI